MAETPKASGRSLAARYAPFLAIIALQLVLVTITPSSTNETTTVAGGTNTGSAQLSETDSSQTGEVSSGTGGSTAASSGGTGSQGAAAPSAGATGGASTAATARPGTATGAATGTRAAGTATASATGQQLDALGRPLSGDKAKCAPGGLLTENITMHSPPCIPKFEGDNGGPTSKGVTNDTIQIVLIYPNYPEAINQALIANGLSATPEQYHDYNTIFAEFLNRHYEMYGRKIKVNEYFTNCADVACIRADAKAINEKFHPFMASWYVDGITGDPMWDEFARLGVITLSAGALSDAWFKQHAPYAWKHDASGSRVADMTADYYCKKMSGKNATLAGDPTMRVKKRKLGIIANDNPAVLDVANRFKSQVSGGQCGSADEGTTIYTVSSDPAQAVNQASTLVTRMKNDGITTQTSFISGAPGSQEDDKQQYYPENLLSGLSQADDDFVGRFSSATGSATQMNNTFGIGWFPKAQPPENHDFMKATKSVNPQANPPYVTQGTFMYLRAFAMMIQWAGPKLTPPNVERGAHSSPQINGYANPNPWPGWKAGNPFAREIKYAGDTNYSGIADAREVYWDSSAISPVDNQPGAWVCVADCRRYEIGQWPKGEPKQAS